MSYKGVDVVRRSPGWYTTGGFRQNGGVGRRTENPRMLHKLPRSRQVASSHIGFSCRRCGCSPHVPGVWPKVFGKLAVFAVIRYGHGLSLAPLVEGIFPQATHLYSFTSRDLEQCMQILSPRLSQQEHKLKPLRKSYSHPASNLESQS